MSRRIKSCKHTAPEPRCTRCKHLVSLHIPGGCVTCQLARRGTHTCRRSRKTAATNSYPSPV